MSQVADAIVHSSGGTTRLIDRIEEAGLVERQVCRSDRRAVYVAITARARSASPRRSPCTSTTSSATSSPGSTSGERATLAALLAKLNAPV